MAVVLGHFTSESKYRYIFLGNTSPDYKLIQCTRIEIMLKLCHSKPFSSLTFAVNYSE